MTVPELSKVGEAPDDPNELPPIFFSKVGRKQGARKEIMRLDFKNGNVKSSAGAESSNQSVKEACTE